LIGWLEIGGNFHFRRHSFNRRPANQNRVKPLVKADLPFARNFHSIGAPRFCGFLATPTNISRFDVATALTNLVLRWSMIGRSPGGSNGR
jgi:hypothetical protein